MGKTVNENKTKKDQNKTKKKKVSKKKWNIDDPKKPLTVKQKIFVMRYIANLGNGTEAVLFAGFKTKHPRTYASELLTKPNIQRYYNEQFEKAFSETGFMVKQSIQNIARMANANILDFFDVEAGEIDPLIKDRTRQETSVIQSIKSEIKFLDSEGNETVKSEKDIIHKKNSIKLYDALRANEIILKMAGKFADKMQPSQNDDKAEANIKSLIELTDKITNATKLPDGMTVAEAEKC